MNKDLEVFENRSDDWLAKEREYEKSVSAWDFDEGKKLKETHEKHHSAYEKAHPDGGVIGRPIKKGEENEIDAQKLGKMLITIIIVIAVVIVLYFIFTGNNIGGGLLEFIPFIIFIVIFAKIAGRKKK